MEKAKERRKQLKKNQHKEKVFKEMSGEDIEQVVSEFQRKASVKDNED